MSEKIRISDIDFKRLNKADLHTHLGGSINVDDIRLISSLCSLDLSDYEPLEQHINFFDENIWTITKKIMSSSIGLQKSIERFLLRQIEDGVTFTEITINFASLIRHGSDMKDITKSIMNALDTTSLQGASAKVKFGVNRKDGPNSLLFVSDLYDRFPSDVRSCVDLNGDERRYPVTLFKEGFRQLSQRKIPYTIHAGEYKELTNSLMDAIQMAPVRIGHGLAAVENDEIKTALNKSQIPLEICPVSSFQTGAILDLNDYPISQLLEINTPLVLGTDDPALFHITATEQFQLLSKLGIGDEKVQELAYNAFNKII